MSYAHRSPRWIGIAATLITAAHFAAAQTIHGIVLDPVGQPVANAKVDLITGGGLLLSVNADARGIYSVAIAHSARYQLRSSAPTFDSSITPSRFFSASSDTALNLTVATPTLTQEVTVSVTGTPTPVAQTGASVTVLPQEDYQYMLQVQDPLRLVPGVQLTQTGEIGGTSGLSIRGGDTDANKVLIDGIPATQIGGNVEFANLASVGIQSIEVLNEPNSAMYGSDAMAGVVNLTSARAASTPLPLFTYAGDAGNFHTYRNEATAGSVYRQFDLYSAYARVQTANNVPNSEFHNGTYAGNFGWTPNASNDARFTVRHVDSSAGQPNAIALYGIADDAQQKEQDLYLAGVWNHQLTPNWHSLVRYGYVRLNGQYNSSGATGIYDPNSGYYDGVPVTITGANGYTVHGQALFQYSDMYSQFIEHNADKSIYAQTDYRVNAHLLALGAFRYESETGAANDAGTPVAPISRGNYSYTIQFSGDLRNRLFYTAGTGLEDNGLFGFAGTPRASLAYYLVRPTGNGIFNGTKLHGTFGKGIKEPSVYQQQNSLYGLLTTAQASQYHAGPLGPEYSRTFDGGIDQQLFNSRIRTGITYFHDEFTNRVEYVPQQGLTELGISAANSAPVNNNGGAYLNSSAFRSQGVETTVEVRLSSHLFTRGGYTYTDAVVQRSFSSDNLYPSFNTPSNFSTIPIGAFSPLVGARPFRVAPNTGFFALMYNRTKFNATLTGTLVSRRDDSDFLSDSNFGNSLLLPNRNLDGAYQRLSLGGGYQLTPRVGLYASLDNLLSEHYFEAFGYPALPFTFRSGIKLNFGGESWKLK
jgi:vitamin B12 transporter